MAKITFRIQMILMNLILFIMNGIIKGVNGSIVNDLDYSST